MGRINRRSLLKVAGVGVGTLLAGCTSNSSGSSGSNDNERIVKNPDNGSSGGSKPFKGVTIQYWDHLNSFTRSAKLTIQQVVKEFEDDTGATVKLQMDGPSAMSKKWPRAMAGGTIPDIHTYTPGYSGSIPPKFWVPFKKLREEYPDEITDKKVSSMDKALSLLEFGARGMDGVKVPQVPALHVPRSPILVRYDLFEEAGVADRLPPDSFAEAVELAGIVQEKTQAKAGYQYPGAKGDYLGFLGPHAVFAGGHEGAILNKSARKPQIGNDAWLEGLRHMKLIKDKGQLVNNTAALSGDAILGTIGSGDYAMVTVEPKFQPTAMNRNHELMKQGALKWYPNWPTPSGQRSSEAINVFNITPKQDNSKKAAKKQACAVHLLGSYMLSDGFQINAASGTGFIPVREDIWDEAEKTVPLEDKHHWFETCTKIIKQTKTMGLAYGVPEENISPIPALSAGGAPVQKMVLGELSAKEAQQEWAKAAQKQYE